MLHFSIWKLSWNNVNDFIRNLSIQTVSELDNTFDFWVNSLIFSDINIFTWFPFETSLSGNNISRVDFFTTKLFQSIFLLWISTQVYDHQNLWCFVSMMLAFLMHWIELKMLMILLLRCLIVDQSCSLFLKNKLTFIFTQLLFNSFNYILDINYNFWFIRMNFYLLLSFIMRSNLLSKNAKFDRKKAIIFSLIKFWLMSFYFEEVYFPLINNLLVAS